MYTKGPIFMAQKNAPEIAVTGVETRNLPGMPIHLEFQRMPASISLTYDMDEPVFTFKRKALAEGMAAYWQEFKLAGVVRDAMFAVKTPLDALRFLEATGFFLQESGPRDDAGFKDNLTWSDFQQWQKLLRFISQHGFVSIIDSSQWEDYEKPWTIYPWRGGRAPALSQELESIIISAPETTKEYLCGDPTIKMRRDERIAEMEKRKPKLEMSIVPFGTVEAILACLFIDQQVGIEYKLCLRDKCENLFISNDKRRKQYCSQACAHHASVTRDRINKASAAEKATPKKAAKRRARKSNG
jgi:hypothetical protein